MGELILLPGPSCPPPDHEDEQTICYDDLRVSMAAEILRLSDRDALVYAAHLKAFRVAVDVAKSPPTR